MDKQQAWDLMVQATSAIQTNRETHNAILKALDVLKPEQTSEA